MRIAGIVSALGFTLCVPLSNWMILNVGVCSDEGPCVIPVFPYVWAPSAVLIIGIALVLRDIVHRDLGPVWAGLLVVIGAAMSVVFASPSLAFASGVAFLISELVDFGVYGALFRRWPAAAILFSGMVGALADSILFLTLAFGASGLSFLLGQMIGKLWASVIVSAYVRLREGS